MLNVEILKYLFMLFQIYYRNFPKFSQKSYRPKERTVDDASRSCRFHRGSVINILIAFDVLEVDVIIDNNGLRVLGQFLDFIRRDVSDYV
jgi:hypothetical protein